MIYVFYKMKSVPQETVLQYIADAANKTTFIEKVVLYGSRVRGTARLMSDYDLAVKLMPGTSITEWYAFTVNADDEAPTLCELAFLHWTDKLRPEFAANIAREGVVVYERNSD